MHRVQNTELQIIFYRIFLYNNIQIEESASKQLYTPGNTISLLTLVMLAINYLYHTE